MALTITVPDAGRTGIGNKRLVFGTIAFDTTYDNEAAAGESLTALDLGLDKIDHIQFTADQINVYWANDLLTAWQESGDAGLLVETPDGNNITTANVGFFAIGR